MTQQRHLHGGVQQRFASGAACLAQTTRHTDEGSYAPLSEGRFGRP